MAGCHLWKVARRHNRDCRSSFDDGVFNSMNSLIRSISGKIATSPEGDEESDNPEKVTYGEMGNFSAENLKCFIWLIAELVSHLSRHQ